MLTALLFELLDAKSGDIKTWVKGRLENTTFINKINTTVENTITKVFSKADQFALLSGKVEKVLESLKANLSEEAFEYLANNLKKDQISDLMEAVRKLEKELGSTEIKLSEAQVKKLLEGLKDGKGVDDMVAELKKLIENSGIRDKRLALGVREHLDHFANGVDAHTWKDFPDRSNWKQGVLDAIQNPEMEMFFNLDGIDSPWAAVTRASKGTARATEWGLLQIKLNPEAWDRVIWYKNGVIVPNPFE